MPRWRSKPKSCRTVDLAPRKYGESLGIVSVPMRTVQGGTEGRLDRQVRTNHAALTVHIEIRPTLAREVDRTSRQASKICSRV